MPNIALLGPEKRSRARLQFNFLFLRRSDNAATKLHNIMMAACSGLVPLLRHLCHSCRVYPLVKAHILWAVEMEYLEPGTIRSSEKSN